VKDDALRLEKEFLAPYATKSYKTKGREHPIEVCPLRTEFQRDRDRIMHCKSFRRLKHKTQVFLAPLGDHYRTRLTHTLEVSQIARTIARGLLLNEDLAEAIALGHDLGHTPFGHSGERALNDITGHFVHAEQSLRVVELLEEDGKGLNLTFEVRDGILNHGMDDKPMTLEGNVVRISDKIAYLNHDIDDAIRAGVINHSDLPDYVRNLGERRGQIINAFVSDILSVSYGKPFVQQSPKMDKILRDTRTFMQENIYSDDSNAGKRDGLKVVTVITMLYEYYLKNPKQMPLHYLAIEPDLKVAVKDYVASMSDTYAIQKFEEIFVPTAWQGGNSN
jgi:dGTPase